MLRRLKTYWNAFPKFDEEIRPQFSLGNMLRAITWLGLWAGALSLPDDLTGVPRHPTWIVGVLGVTYIIFLVSAPLMAIFALIGQTQKGLLFCFYALLCFVILYCAVACVIQFI
jgi:hypothetical protein